MSSLPSCLNRCRLAALAVTLVALAGCGGGGGDGPAVQNLSASNVRYANNMVVSVSGRSLDQGIELTVDGPCSSVTVLGAISESAAQFSCLVTGPGLLIPRVRQAGGGKELASVQLSVPTPQVTMTVTDGKQTGTIVVELDPVAAPRTAAQFMLYALDGFYKDMIFHRVQPSTAILGGGYVAGQNNAVSGKATTRNPIPLEVTGLKNLRGTLAMYREGGPDTANSMFFINTVDNPRFDRGSAETPEGYAVFGRVVKGLDIVDIIAAVPVRWDLNLNVNDVPVTPVKISAISQTR